jgi:hypothetical protein
MVAGAVAGNISPEATSPAGNIFTEAMRGHHQYAALHLAHPGRQDGELVVLGEILIRPVDVRIVAMSLGALAFKVVGLMCPSRLCVRTVSEEGITREAHGLVGT